jgi:transcriptional regulator with GAF, ATPase, and Fis domain
MGQFSACQAGNQGTDKAIRAQAQTIIKRGVHRTRAVLGARRQGRLGDALRRKIRGVDEAAMQALLRYQWPGNLRELDNVIQAAVIRCPRGRCTGDALFSSNGSNRAYSGLLSPKRRPKNPLTSHHPLAS